jgi:hypothetical protein
MIITGDWVQSQKVGNCKDVRDQHAEIVRQEWRDGVEVNATTIARAFELGLKPRWLVEKILASDARMRQFEEAYRQHRHRLASTTPPLGVERHRVRAEASAKYRALRQPFLDELYRRREAATSDAERAQALTEFLVQTDGFLAECHRVTNEAARARHREIEAGAMASALSDVLATS